MPTEISEIWRHAKPILLPYEGMASQLYVLDLPIGQLGAIVDIFQESVSDPVVVTLDDYTDEARPLTPEMRSALLTPTKGNTSHQLQGLRAGRENLSMFLRLDSKSQMFDAELVFWADQLFPDPNNDSECLTTLEQYLEIAASIRSVSPGSECVISGSETGDPRDDRDKPWTYWW